MTSLSAKVKSFLPRKGFARAVAIVSGGTALGQIVTVLASPLLSRLYSPGDFGELAVYLSLTGSIAMVAGLTYQMAVPLPEEDDEAANVLVLATSLVLAVGLITALGLFASREFLSQWPRTARIAGVLWLVPFGVLGIGLFETITQWAVRAKQFGPLARTSAAKGVAQVGVQSAWGVFAPGALGLLVGQLVGQWAGTFTLVRLAWREQYHAFQRVSVAGMLAAAKRYKRFPLLTLPEVLVNAVSFFAPVLILAYYFGGYVAGLYAFQDRVTLIPIRFVGASAQRVFMASAADARRENRLDTFTRRVFGYLLAISTPFIFLLASSAPNSFALVFGENWREAGVYAQWLCVRTAFTMVVFPLTPLVYVLEKQWAGTAFQVVLLILRVGPIVLGGMLGSARLAIMLTGLGVGLSWLIYLVYLLMLSGNKPLPVLRLAALEVVIAAVICVPVVAVRLLVSNDIAVTLTAAAMGLVALALLWKRRSTLGLGALAAGPSNPQAGLGNNT